MPTTNKDREMRIAQRRVEGFAQQFGEAHRNLARHAAFPLVLTPDLLYQIWANFVPEAPWTAVAHVLLSRLCRQVGYEMYEMDIGDRNLLLRELKGEFGQERFDELGEFLLDYVAQRLTDDDADTQDLREAQEWTALAYTKPDEAARELALALSQKVQQEDMGEVLRLASLVETLAQPLIEAGFEPLLVYSCGIKYFVRDNFVGAATEFSKIAGWDTQFNVDDINLLVPKQIIKKITQPTDQASLERQFTDIYSVIIHPGIGDLNNGFPRGTIQLRDASQSVLMQFTISLPSAPELLTLYKRWRLLYMNLCGRMRLRSSPIEDDDIFEIDDEAITNVSDYHDFKDLCRKLRQSINQWLDTQNFINIERQLRAQLDLTKEIRVIIVTDDEVLMRLPWHLWDFLEDYPFAEIALYHSEYYKISQISGEARSQRKKVRILAIIGNSQGMDLEAEALKKLQDSEVVFLVNPSRNELSTYLRNSIGWDIFFFAGHTQNEADTNRSIIYINTNIINNSITIEELEESFRAAIKKGLKLAIFNSCDGLGIALALGKLFLPTILVMREPIPHVVAKEFFKHFLNTFAIEQKSLYLAVRNAREKLQGLEDEFPAASWLPVIFQNPAVLAPTWQGFLN
ncbi:CHAT domain-containing protein [Mastigocladopsis repens]|uniref:CHAT domain-containing protein n=1 Tax=Mastigocladopsis repens TaxID=221287 RepID=UPI000316E15C|nr:CHAT domain-containing protein [Mastigocladopsis repens]